MKVERKFRWKDIGGLLKDTYHEWNDDDAFTNAAAVSYYAVFSLPAIMIIIVTVAGYVFGEAAVAGKISDTISGAMGQDAARQIETMIASAHSGQSSGIMTVIGILTLLVGATGLFIQLQKSLNRMWDVKTNPDAGVGKMLIDRMLSLGVILSIGFLLMISLVVTAAVSALTGWLMTMIPDFLVYGFYILDFILSFATITLLFALIFKMLPDVKIEFRSVWVGAAVTAFLFMLGKFGISIYLGKSEPGSAYGAAGSLILILLWVYYSCLILFFGAEFTQIFAMRYNHRIEPAKYAVKINPCEDFSKSAQTT
jgi:membrane protein